MRRITGICLAALICVASTAPALTVSDDGRQILGNDGHPVFLNGATPWHILTRLDRSESLQYLDARRSMGFNALLLSVIVNDDYRTNSFDNAFGDAPFLADNDFARPNEAYFEHVDWFLDQAMQRGMYVLMEPAYIGWECNIEGFCAAMQRAGVETMREYGRWLGDRYKGYDNLIWVNGGDADAAAHGAMDVVDAVAEGIRAVSPDQLHTAHCNRENSAIDCYDRPWLDLNNTYSDCNGTPGKLRTDWNRAQAFFYIEGFYEGEHETSAVCLRSQAYWSLLGGAQGHFFGNRPMWDFWNGWEQALDSKGSWSMRHFADLVHSRSWSQLAPDWSHEVLVSGYGSVGRGYAAAARTHDGNTVVVYTPERRTLTVDMERVSGNQALAWWFNPENGTTIFLDTIPTSGTRAFTPPFSGDWVLVIDDEAAELPAPGEGRGIGIQSASRVKARYSRRRPDSGMDTAPSETGEH